MSLQKLSDRHEALAVMVAAGMPEHEQLERTKYSAVRLSDIKGEPIFKLRVRELRARWTSSVLEEAAEQLRGEVMPSLRTLAMLRDDSEVDPAVRRNCAKDLAFDGFLDRVWPKGQPQGGNTPGAQAAPGSELLDNNLVKRILIALGEVGATVNGEVEDAVVETGAATPFALPPPRRSIKPMTPEEFAVECGEADPD